MNISSRDITITFIITLGLAIIIVSIFMIISSQKDKNIEATQSQALIDEIKNQALNEEGEPISKDEEKDFKETETTYSGRITNINIGQSITITTNTGSLEIITTELEEIFINQNQAQESSLSSGDIIQVLATLKKDGNIYAKKITVTRSTSPTIPANVSEPTIQPPAVESRPVSAF